MLQIAIALLWGLILSWFGFDTVVETGMKEVFNQNITSTGYYFLFGLLGALRSMVMSFNAQPLKLDLNKKED